MSRSPAPSFVVGEGNPATVVDVADDHARGCLDRPALGVGVALAREVVAFGPDALSALMAPALALYMASAVVARALTAGEQLE